MRLKNFLQTYIALLSLAITLAIVRADECFTKGDIMAGPVVSKLGLKYFSDQEFLYNDDFKGNLLTNGFYYCLDSEDGHLTGLQFFVETLTEVYKLKRAGSPLRSDCHGLRIYEDQSFDNMTIYFNE